MPGIFDPLVPKSWIRPAQDALDQRSLDQSPLEAQIRGFGAGALEGLRGLTSPVELASMLPAGKLLKFAPKMARAAGPTLDLLEQTPVAQVMPEMDDVASLLGSLKHNLAQVPQAGSRAQVLANLPTEFQQPVSGLKKAMNPYAEEMVTKYLRK